MMDIMKVYSAVDSALRDRTRPWTLPFVWLEGRTGIGHVKLLVGCLFVALASVFASGRMVMLLSNLLGFAYPTYATMQFMVRDGMQRDSPSPTVPNGEPGQQQFGQFGQLPGQYALVPPATRWLTYWITFAAVLIVQQLCGDVLQIIPFYFLAKTVFFAWCSLPMEANGAAFVHRFVMRDYLKRFFDSADLATVY